MVEIKTYAVVSPTDPLGEKMAISAVFNTTDLVSREINHSLIREVVRQIAERYVQEHYPQIVEKLDQQAIANLVIAESGKKIAEEIRLTTPPPTVKTKREVYQRGFFGGMRRVL